MNFRALPSIALIVSTSLAVACGSKTGDDAQGTSGAGGSDAGGSDAGGSGTGSMSSTGGSTTGGTGTGGSGAGVAETGGVGGSLVSGGTGGGGSPSSELGDAIGICESTKIELRLNTDSTMTTHQSHQGRGVNVFELVDEAGTMHLTASFEFMSMPGSVELFWPAFIPEGTQTTVTGRIVNIDGDHCFSGEAIVGAVIEGEKYFYFAADQFAPANGEGSCDGVEPSTPGVTVGCISTELFPF